MNTATDLLSKKHRQYLRDAGISDEIITGRGYVTIRPGRNPDSVRRNLKDEFGIWVQDARQLSGILIPLWGTQSYREPVSHVFRPDTPEIDSKGKPRKYVYPTGKPPVLDLHPVTRKRGVLGDRDTDLWITEGAKKADALASRGLAVIMISGVQMWRAGGEPLHDWDAVYLRGRTAYVCFDADASVNHNVARAMGDLGASLAHSGANVKYVVTPGDPKQKTGADDFLSAGGTVDELVAAASDDPPKVHRVSVDLPETEVYPQLAEHLRDEYLWVHGLGWHRWDTTRWRPVSDESVRIVAAEWVREQWKRALDSAKDTPTSAALDFAKKWLSYNAKSKIDNVLALVKGVLEIPADSLDGNPDLLNCANGTVDLSTGELLPHNPDDHITKSTGVRYVPGARHPDWKTALTAVPDEVVDWVQVKMGQGITGYTHDDDITMFLQGSGANGKTTLVSAVAKSLGDYYMVVAARALLADPKAHTTELTEFRGARFAVLEELPERHMSVTRIKLLNGGTKITARRIAQDSITFDPTHTLFVTTNHIPDVADTDYGTWRRMALVRFPFTFVDEPDPEVPTQRQADPELRQRVSAGDDEGFTEAVLEWLVAGAREWYGNNKVLYAPPQKVVDDTLAWRMRADTILRFWEECLEPDHDVVVPSGDMLTVFNGWMQNNGQMPVKDKTFADRFGSHQETERNQVVGPKMIRIGKREVSRHPSFRDQKLPKALRGWSGVRLRTDATPEMMYGEWTI